jgi:cell division protein FtsZ
VAVPAATPAPAVAGGLSPHRRPLATHAAPQATGERLVSPATPPPSQPAAPSTPAPVAAAPARPAVNGGGITVPPLPPIPGPVAGRRPLSNEDFEEELDIPEFLKG